MAILLMVIFIVKKKNSVPTNRTFEQKEILLNNIDDSIQGGLNKLPCSTDAQNIKYQIFLKSSFTKTSRLTNNHE